MVISLYNLDKVGISERKTRFSDREGNKEIWKSISTINILEIESSNTSTILLLLTSTLWSILHYLAVSVQVDGSTLENKTGGKLSHNASEYIIFEGDLNMIKTLFVCHGTLWRTP